MSQIKNRIKRRLRRIKRRVSISVEEEGDRPCQILIHDNALMATRKGSFTAAAFVSQVQPESIGMTFNSSRFIFYI